MGTYPQSYTSFEGTYTETLSDDNDGFVGVLGGGGDEGFSSEDDYSDAYEQKHTTQKDSAKSGYSDESTQWSVGKYSDEKSMGESDHSSQWDESDQFL